MIGRLLLHCWYSLGRRVMIGTPMVIFAVLTVLWLFLVHGWYSLGRHVTTGTPVVIFMLFWLCFECFWRLVQCTIRQKQSKDSQNSKNHHWCTNRHMSTQSPPDTQSRANAATLRNLHYMCLGSGDSPSPVGRADCMDVHASGSRSLPYMLLHSLLPTDDAYCSSSVSTTVIKFSIFSDPTRKLSPLPRELRGIR